MWRYWWGPVGCEGVPWGVRGGRTLEGLLYVAHQVGYFEQPQQPHEAKEAQDAQHPQRLCVLEAHYVPAPHTVHTPQWEECMDGVESAGTVRVWTVRGVHAVGSAGVV
jgi:hypothetical protein